MTPNHKVYYGEYSLMYWIKLMLTGNITLPPYQRYFVWDDVQSRLLIQSLEHSYYIPAVTIATVEDPTTHQPKNIILDGQQRLTSILLAYLGKYPVKRLTAPQRYAEEGDAQEGEEKKSEWNYTTLLSYGSDKTGILNDIAANHPHDYNPFVVPGVTVDEPFLESHFLHFAYVVPDMTIARRERNKYLTNVFYCINSHGTQLSHLECRNALYYQGGNNKETFDPAFSQRVKVNNAPMDFVRYLTIISNYKKVGEENFWAAMDIRSKREAFYVEFIRDFLTKSLDENTKLFKFTNYGANKNRIEPALTTLGLLDKDYTSIIDLDVYYTGIFYYIMIEGKELDATQWEAVKEQLDTKKDEFTANRKHRKRPAQVGYFRDRVKASIQLYEPLFP